MCTIDTSPVPTRGRESRALSLKFLAAMALVMAFIGIEATWSPGAIDISRTAPACDKVASPFGSNSNSGTVAKPFATVDRLARSLQEDRPAACAPASTSGDVKVRQGRRRSARRSRSRAIPASAPPCSGRLHVADHGEQRRGPAARPGRIQPREAAEPDGQRGQRGVPRQRRHEPPYLDLLPARRVEWGRARGTVIERNRIHNCGQLPPSNHHHGIYAEATDNARIVDNWIYDNADRGVQMFPDAQRTYVARNVLDGNGQRVVFSRLSGTTWWRTTSSPIRWCGTTSRTSTSRPRQHPTSQLPVEHASPRQSSRLPAGFRSRRSRTSSRTRYLNRAAKDFRLLPGSPCLNLSRQPRRSPKRPRSSNVPCACVRGGSCTGRAACACGLRYRPDTIEGAQKRAPLKIRRHGLWLASRRPCAWATAPLLPRSDKLR